MQVLGAGSRECASHSLYYFLEQHRILFNVSEGLQRLATQHRLKIAPNKMSAVFLTRLDWECFGGLPGLILTMGDTAKLFNSEEGSTGGASILRIIGPRHLKHAVAAMRPFLHRRDFAVEVEELCVDGEISHWHDSKSDVDVWAYEICESTCEEEEDKTFIAKCEKTGNVVMEEMEPHHFLLRMFQSEFSVQANQTEREERCEEYAGRLAQNFSYNGVRSLVYVVQGPTQPGKFDRAAALARGIKPGPLFGKLSRGEVVVLDDGTIVEPECCVGPKRSSPAFMIFDISTANLARSAFSKISELRELMKKPQGEKDSCVSVIIHLLGEEIVNNENLLKEYRQFCVNLCDSFGDVKNYFSAPNDAILMTSSVELQLTLKESLGANEFFPSGRQPANYLEIPELAKPLDRITVSPGETVSLENSQTFLTGICAETDVAKVEEEGIWISALGTGSAIPGKYRNVSSTFIENYETNEMIFLDCGEMTIGQIHRLFGAERTGELLSRTSAILISHKHGDHHLGALSLIKAVGNARPDGKVLLVAPERFKIWLEEFAQVCDFGLSRVKFVACGDIHEEPLKLGNSGTLVKAFDVDHCHEAFGFQITFRSSENNSRIVYSGDTRPCDSVIDNAHECDLLIHEATMSNDLLHEAIVRKHCTIAEAVNVGVQSKSRALLLTHFSQRYAKGALTLDPSQHGEVKVAMGVDLLRFPLKSIDRVSELALKMSELLPVDKEEPGTEN